MSDRLCPRFVAEREGLGDRQGLGDPGRLDQQVVKAPLARHPLDLDQQVLAQRAADAAVAHLDKLLFRARELRAALAHELRVDVDFGHVVDDHGNPAALAVVQHMIEQGGLAGAQEAGQDGDGKSLHEGSSRGVRSLLCVIT